MKIKKTMTAAATAANRDNSKKSTGPKTEQGKSAASRNSLRHGILSRKMVFETRKQRAEYHGIWESWNQYFCPQGPLEEYLVQEITNVVWKLGITETLELKELSQRQSIKDCINGVFDNDLELPIDENDIPLDRAWNCEKLVIRAIAGDDESNSSGSHQPRIYENKIFKDFQTSGMHTSRKGSHLVVEAVLGGSLETLTRYRSTLKKDLYRAIETLHTLQKQRRQQQNGNPSP